MTAIRRRTLLAGAPALLAAPALIGRARAATALKVSTSFSNDPKFSTGRIWYDLFLPRLKEATKGEVVTEFFPDSQLGQEADIVTQLKAGVVDMMLAGTSIWSNVVPEFGAMDLGYVFDDYNHMLRASRTPAAAALQTLLVQRAGAHLPSWGRNLGARNFLTKFKFSEPAQLAGRKIRSLPSPWVTETVKMMGAAATPLAFGEVYTALQAGVIDGLEHDAPTILSSKFYEAAKIFTLTRHIYSPFGAFVSDRTLKRLTPAQGAGLLQAVREATADHFKRAAQVEAAAVKELQTKGVTVETCDRAAFRKRMPPMWASFLKTTPSAKPMLDAIHRTFKA
ncbi:MAG: TRAP transporter substrate-binding protein [Proteobacteria bacterium]|nr:TRAP transporter substrate-binding protein [Pseudomonadota bacterium]